MSVTPLRPRLTPAIALFLAIATAAAAQEAPVDLERITRQHGRPGGLGGLGGSER